MIQFVADQDVAADLRERFEKLPRNVCFIPNDFFCLNGAEDQFFGSKAKVIHIPEWIPLPALKTREYGDGQWSDKVIKERGRMLSRADEVVIFLRYNYAKYRFRQLRNMRYGSKRAQIAFVWHSRINELRNDIAEGNMALVYAMAKNANIERVEHSELVSEGSLALLRAIEKFDASRGNKFSTYACRSILKAFNRLSAKTGSYYYRFPSGLEFDSQDDNDDYSVEQESNRHEVADVHELTRVLAENRANLSVRELSIIETRYGIGRNRGRGGKTLAQMGKASGITRERIRQIEKRAILKLRAVMN